MRTACPIIIHDLVLAGLSLWLTLYLRFGADIPPEYSGFLIYGIPLFVVIAGVMFHSFGMYRALWRYASIPDLIAIIRAVSVSLLIFWLVVYATAWLDIIPRSLPVIQWLLLVVMLGGPRIIIRVRAGESWMSPLRRKAPTIPVLLAGTTDEASLFVRAAYESENSPFRVVGILDDSGKFVGRSLHRVPVLGRIDELRKVVSRLAVRGPRPTQLIIATPRGSIPPQAFARLMDEAEDLGLTVARTPNLVELEAAPASAATELHPVKLEDLLGRPQIELDRAPIAHLINARRVLITGAGGSIGSELARQIAALDPAELILLDACEFNLYDIDQEIRGDFPDVSVSAVLCNVRDHAGIDRVFAQHAPDLVFHAAALKHVPLVEANLCDGILTNTIGTRIVADAVLRHHAIGMIQISTDKAIEPESAMGASKHLAENYCQALDVATGGERASDLATPRFITVRFGNVLGSSGSVVPLFQRQLARGGPLTVTHPEMRRFFMTVREAVELVLHASAHGIDQPEHRGQIFVLDMGQPIRIVDIARQLIRMAGLYPDTDVKILFTGLRPGERLDEHLFNEQEKQIPTSVAGVLRAVSPARDLRVVRRELDELAELAALHRPEPLRALLSRLVPSYRGARIEEPVGASLRCDPRSPL